MYQPVTGSDNAYVMRSPAFIQLTTGQKYDLSTLTINSVVEWAYGTNASTEYTPIADGIGVGKYFIFNTPSNKFCFYNTTLPTGLAVSDVTVFRNLGSLGATHDVATIISAVKSSCDNIAEIVFIESSTKFTLRAKDSGIALGGTAGTSTFTVVATAGTCTGGWSRLGALADDISASPESDMKSTSESKDYEQGVKMPIKFSMINTSSRSLDILMKQWRGKEVDIMFLDKTDAIKPLVIYREVICNITPDLLNRDGARFTISGSGNFKSDAEFMQYKTFENEV